MRGKAIWRVQALAAKALVTGGGGFLGGRIARMLKERGHDVTVFSRGAYPHLENEGVRVVRGDLRDKAAVCAACSGQDIVFHVAALTGIWGPSRLFWDINVTGTLNVIAGCRDRGISRLVYTSSPSVVFGEEELCGVDESQAYPSRWLTPYAETKAIAEQAVLAANGTGLATIALRPHLVWGPGDPHLIPRVIERARACRLVQVGDGSNVVDITYIDNAAIAHIQAGDALQPTASCSGSAYFISQGVPVVLWVWLRDLLARVGAPSIRRKVGYRTAYWVGALMELLGRITFREREPLMTRFLAAQLAQSHYFSIEAARRDFGYRPSVSTEEGMERLVRWLGGEASGLEISAGDKALKKVAPELTGRSS
jgi:2-alkyl-3-oxoalkanoate reductase